MDPSEGKGREAINAGDVDHGVARSRPTGFPSPLRQQAAGGNRILLIDVSVSPGGRRGQRELLAKGTIGNSVDPMES